MTTLVHPRGQVGVYHFGTWDGYRGRHGRRKLRPRPRWGLSDAWAQAAELRRLWLAFWAFPEHEPFREASRHFVESNVRHALTMAGRMRRESGFAHWAATAERGEQP